MSAATWWKLPSPERTIARWHVSPLVDAAGYGWSWLWILVPMLFVGNARSEYLYAYILTLVLTDAHRHYGLPYVYFDSSIRRRHPVRFGWFPLLLLAGFVASPLWVQARLRVAPETVFAGLAWLPLLVTLLRRDVSTDAPSAGLLWRAVGAPLLLPAAAWAALGPGPGAAWAWIAAALASAVALDFERARRGLAVRGWTPGLVAAVGLACLALASPWRESLSRGTLRFSEVFDAIAVFAGIWNFWHVYAQKYGILRMYSAKNPGSFKVPGYADRLLVFAWLPLYVTWLVPSYADDAYKQFRQARGIIPGIAQVLEAIQPVAAPLALAFLCFALGTYLRFEWRASRFRNPARNTMALGTTVLGAAFFVVDPIKCYLAFAFSHAIEYMVFVWAYQRRRYRSQLDHDPLLGRMLHHPMLFYGVLTALLCGAAFYFGYVGRSVLTQLERPTFHGISGARWLVAWTIYQSMMHFYFDGFLWKMRDEKLTSDL